jgi:adenylate kinase family enzyme
MTGGLPGAGKSTFLNAQGAKLGINPNQYVQINPDLVKTEMQKAGMVPDYGDLGITPEESVALYHEESSHIAAMIAATAGAQGKNVLIDTTLGTTKQYDRYLSRIETAGPYKKTVVFLDTPKETSLLRSTNRYTSGDRFVPLENISNVAVNEEGKTANRQVFDQIAPNVERAILVDADGSIKFPDSTSGKGAITWSLNNPTLASEPVKP